MRTLHLMLIAAIMAACTEVSFKEPQPQGVKTLATIPGKLQGAYIMETNGTKSGKIVVEARGYRIEKEDSTETAEEYLLSDSLVLKYYKGYYFINMRDESVWILRVIKRQQDGNLVLMELPALSESQARRSAQLEELKQIAPVTETEINGSKVYIMEPTPRQLLELLRKGYFRKQTTLRKL